MTTFPYILLADSEGTIVKRFRVIKMETPFQNTSTFEITAGGGIDKSAGAIIEMFLYTFKINEEELDPNYAALADLKALFMLNNPSPTSGLPSDLLTLTDHYGVEHSVKFRDDISPEPVTTQLEGPNAIHYVNVTLIKVNGVGGSGS